MSQRLLKSAQAMAREEVDAAIEKADAAIRSAEFWQNAVEVLEILVAYKCEDCEYYNNRGGCDDDDLDEDCEYDDC